MENEKLPSNGDIQHPFRIVTCNTSKPNAVNIIKTVKKNQKKICCGESITSCKFIYTKIHFNEMSLIT